MGAQREVAKEVFEDIKENKEVLALAFSLASMVLTNESDQQWLDGEVAMLETNFPALVLQARRCAEGINDPDVLQKALLQVLSSKDVDVARRYLLKALEEKVL